MNTANYAFGEVEKLFLPGSGYRDHSSGALGGAGMTGYYWSSTYYDTRNTYELGFGSSSVRAGYSTTKAYGQPVRGVAEF
ncbi:MAG: fibrobacter succinogenes major paralogous domain-containing protein [Prevotellaceae bacterium]|jgi:hypothetical protein|nr:fibrobacter succinogenes major paralogous domain-containing protein [Prevotellaceae bacterium]